jgi:hypothetical protein
MRLLRLLTFCKHLNSCKRDYGSYKLGAGRGVFELRTVKPVCYEYYTGPINFGVGRGVLQVLTIKPRLDRRWMYYRMSQKKRSIFWTVIVSAILRKNLYMYMCPIPNGFRDRAISLHSTLFTVQTSNTPCPHTS